MVRYQDLENLIGDEMSFDSVSDMFCSLNNARIIKKPAIFVPKSKLKLNILKLLKEERIISDFSIEDKNIKIELLYFKGLPTFKKISKVSKSSLRVYIKKDKIKLSESFFYIVSTSKLGIIKDVEAVKNNLGGEVIGKVV